MSGSEPTPDSPTSTPSADTPTPESPHADAPPSWLFAARSLGGSFRVFMPTLVLAKVVGLTRIVILGYLMLSAEYTLLRLALLWINLAAAMVLLGVPSGLGRYVPAYERAGQLRAFIGRVAWLSLAISVAAMAVLAALAAWLAPLVFGASDETLRPHYLWLLTLGCLLVVLLMALYCNLTGVLRGLRMYRAVALQELLHSTAFFVMAIAALIVIHGGSRSAGGALIVVLAYGGAIFVPLAVIGLGLARHLGRWGGQHQPLDRPVRAVAGQVFRFSGFVMAASLLANVTMLFGLWYARRFHGEAADLLAFPRDLMQWVVLLSMGIWPAAQNAANRLWEHEQRAAAVDQLRLVFRISSWGLWLMSAFILLAASPLLGILPQEYATTGPLWPWLLVFFLIMANQGLPYAQSVLQERSRALSLSAAVVLAVHVGAALVLAPSGVSFAPLDAAVAVAISGVAGVAAGAATLWLLVLTARHPGTWITGRELIGTLAPALLLLPWIWPQGGRIALAAVTGLLIAALLFTPLLWSTEDRRTLAGFLRNSLPRLARR